MHVLARFRRGVASGWLVNTVFAAVMLAVIVWACARMDDDRAAWVFGGVGGTLLVGQLVYCGWLGLSALLRCPAMWIEGGDLTWLTLLPGRARLDDIASYKFQCVRSGKSTLIWGVRLHMRDGRRHYVNLIMLDGSEAVVVVLRQHVHAEAPAVTGGLQAGA